MKAVRYHKQGGLEVMQCEDVATGDPGQGQVRIRHTAIGVNFVDTYQRSGLYPMQLLCSAKIRFGRSDHAELPCRILAVVDVSRDLVAIVMTFIHFPVISLIRPCQFPDTVNLIPCSLS